MAELYVGTPNGVQKLKGKSDTAQIINIARNGNPGYVDFAPLPYCFYEGCAVVYRNEIHILGGGSSDEDRKSHYKFNGSEWVSVSELPYTLYGGMAVVLNDEIHIIACNDNGHYKWNGNSWSKVSNNGQIGGCAVVYNGEIHVLGGTGRMAYAHNKWNGTSWVSLTGLPFPFTNGSAVVCQGKIHILGSSYSVDYFRSHYSYDDSGYSESSAIPYNFHNGCAVVRNESIYILGSSNNSNVYTEIGVCYTDSSGTASWGSVSSDTFKIGHSFYDGCAVIYNGAIIVLGSGQYLSEYIQKYSTAIGCSSSSIYLPKGSSAYMKNGFISGNASIGKDGSYIISDNKDTGVVIANDSATMYLFDCDISKDDIKNI